MNRPVPNGKLWWCERTRNKLIISLLLDLILGSKYCLNDIMKKFEGVIRIVLNMILAKYTLGVPH